MHKNGMPLLLFSISITSNVPRDLRVGPISRVTDPKFWNALQSINRDKALGPDGYMLTFFPRPR